MATLQQHDSKRGEDKLLKWERDSGRMKKNHTVIYVCISPYVCPSVCQSLSHFVSFSSQATQPLQLAPALLPSAVFTHFWQLTQNTRKTRRYLVLFQFVCLPRDSLFWPIAHEKPQAATESTTRNPLPVHWTPLSAGGGFLSAASAIDSLNYLDRRAPKPFSAHHKLPKSKRLSIRP